MKRFSLHRLALIISLVFILTASAARAQSGCSLTGDDSLPGTPYAGNSGLPIDQGLLIEGAEMARLLGVDPAIFYLQESRGPNAFALSRRFPDLLAAEGRPYAGPDGTVFIGVQLIRSEWQTTIGTGLSIPAIEMHEFTHIAQNKYGFPYQGKWRELHADYVAGWYVGHRGRFPGLLNNPIQAMNNFFDKGDYDFNSPRHHGTPNERKAAFLAGYNLNVFGNVSSGILAYQYGVEYIKSL